jgi:hypothetical protein
MYNKLDVQSKLAAAAKVCSGLTLSSRGFRQVTPEQSPTGTLGQATNLSFIRFCHSVLQFKFGAL